MSRKKFISIFLKKQSISFFIIHKGVELKEIRDLKDIEIANDTYINSVLYGYQIIIIE